MPTALVSYAGQAPGAGTVTPSAISSLFGGFFRNKIMNGDFRIAQRGTSFSTPNNGAYTLDRWLTAYDGTIGAFTLSQQAFTVGQTDVPDEPQSFLRWNQTSAGSGSSFRRIAQRIENVRVLAGKTATITFYAKADASRNVDVDAIQTFNTSAPVTTNFGTFGLTTSWQKFTASISVPSISGKTLSGQTFLEIRFSLPINTAMTIDLSHVQVEERGATPFEQRPQGVESDMCNRYYQIIPMTIGSTATTIPFKTKMAYLPVTFTGGGAGFATANMEASGQGGCASQTTPANITLTMEAEL